MTNYVDVHRWEREVARPDWYLRLRDEYEALLTQARNSPRPVAEAIAGEVYSFFEDALDRGTIALGDSGPDWDADRVPVDTAVIHHTNLRPGIAWRRIDAIHLTRIYARYYADPAPAERGIRGTPIHSGHFRGERQLFVGYHWLVREDGEVERLLEDHETGWQAGDWDVNCRSVGICLDGAFGSSTPPPAMIAAVARLVRERYPDIVEDRMHGHREINPATTCPGDRFLPEWKAELLGALRSA